MVRAEQTTPRRRYESCVQSGLITADPAQFRAIDALEELHARLLEREARRRSPLGRWRMLWGNGAREAQRGLYLWGGVGRGKTFLADLFYDALPLESKLRVHFHRFMRRVHRELTALSGARDPLRLVADGFAAEAEVLCFDELFVSDIADAMILGELLDALFARGVTLVATSNVAPRQLYENGLQRRRFLPAIELIERQTRVMQLDGALDYRLRTLERAELYHYPLDDGAESGLRAAFDALVPDAGNVVSDVELEIEGRAIRCRRCGDDVAWFDFEALCEGPRSQNDYIELARIFHAVLVSGVPVFRWHNEDAARRFIALVDEFYERNVKLILSAQAPIEALYQGEGWRFEFQRTASRLIEMQAHDYLGRVHRA